MMHKFNLEKDFDVIQTTSPGAGPCNTSGRSRSSSGHPDSIRQGQRQSQEQEMREKT